MTNRYRGSDWKRLGTAVQAARMRHRDKGWENMASWADEVGRSTRVLLGLERGEPTGPKTLRQIEELLHWPAGYAERILEDPDADTAPDVAPPLSESFAPFDPDPRPLDGFTFAELVREIEDRYNEMAFEVHTLGRPAVTSREEREGDEIRTIIEPMSPAARRRLMRQASPRSAASDQQGPTADTGGENRE